jgi:Na+/proline symporter
VIGSLTGLDLIILGLYLCIPISIGLAYRKRGAKDTDSFFLSGRSLPWWLAGTSMAADTFASDTPLYIAGLVRREGIAGNWQWWSFAISGLLSVFVMAKLWRRSHVVTDVEFVELRYGGRSAAVLRGIKAFLLAVPFNCLLLGGMPVLAMAKITMIVAGGEPGDAFGEGVAKAITISICLGIVLAYSTVSGLWAIVVNDFVLFWLAFAGAIALCFYSVGAVGGLDSLREGIQTVNTTKLDRMAFLPGPGTAFSAFLVFVGVQWWVHRTVDGGGVNIQRMLACKSEGHAVGATLWFNIINYGIRTWPWILTALAAILLYPTVVDAEMAYPMMLRDHLPAGIRGFVLASIFASFTTTADTQLNWGASYLVNDIYRRFVKPAADDAHYLRISRWAVLLLAAITAMIAFASTSVTAMFGFLIQFFAGTGTVFLGRWLWWRVNAWGELAAIITAPLATLLWAILRRAPDALGDGGGKFHDVPGFWGVPFTASITFVAWVVVTLSTRPVPMDRLVEFYRRTRPPGFWGPVRRAAELPAPDSLTEDVISWLAGLALVLGVMIGIGKALFGTPMEAAAAFIVAVPGAVWLLFRYRR